MCGVVSRGYARVSRDEYLGIEARNSEHQIHSNIEMCRRGTLNEKRELTCSTESCLYCSEISRTA